VDHGGLEAGKADQGPLLHLQVPGQEVWRAADGTTDRALDGTCTGVRVYSGGSVWATFVSGPLQQKEDGQGLGGGVIFVCTVTYLVHVEMTESYSTDPFLMALRQFMTVYGAPRRFQSDQGDQLVVASKQLATWN
jgi:hypothetical protein